MAKETVSAKSFFALLYLSLLSSIFMYLSSSQVMMSNTDSVFRPIVFIFLTFLFAIPTFLFINKSNQKCLQREVPETKTLKVIAFLYAVIYFVASLRTVARFDLFASCELFSGSDMTFFMVFFVVICGFISLLGLNSLCRSATVFCVVVIFTTGFVMLSLIEQVDLLNLTPLLRNGFFTFSKESVLFTVQASEMGAILLFLPSIKGDVKKEMKRWIVLSGISFSVIMFFVVASMGAFSDTQLFPTYTAVTIANFGALERLDALETAIWILCVVEKIAFYILIVSKALSYCFKKVQPKVLTLIICGLIVLVIFLISKDVEKFFFVVSKYFIYGVYFSGVVILPMVLLILKKKGKLNENKIKENI